MNNKKAEQNYGQQADTINNHGSVNFWLWRQRPAIERLFEHVPERHQPEVERTLEHAQNLTARELTHAFKARALGFGEKIVRQWVALDYLCGLIFGGYFFLWAALFLGLMLQYRLSLASQTQAFSFFLACMAGTVISVRLYVVPQLIAARFIAIQHSKPKQVTEA